MNSLEPPSLLVFINSLEPLSLYITAGLYKLFRASVKGAIPESNPTGPRYSQPTKSLQFSGENQNEHTLHRDGRRGGLLRSGKIKPYTHFANMLFY